MARGKPGFSTQNPEIKRLLKRLKKDGWEVVPTRGYVLAYPPGAVKGSQGVYIPSSPSGMRWKANVEAALKRALKQAQAGEKVRVRL